MPPEERSSTTTQGDEIILKAFMDALVDIKTNSIKGYAKHRASAALAGLCPWTSPDQRQVTGACVLSLDHDGPHQFAPSENFERPGESPADKLREIRRLTGG